MWHGPYRKAVFHTCFPYNGFLPNASWLGSSGPSSLWHQLHSQKLSSVWSSQEASGKWAFCCIQKCGTGYKKRTVPAKIVTSSTSGYRKMPLGQNICLNSFNDYAKIEECIRTYMQCVLDFKSVSDQDGFFPYFLSTCSFSGITVYIYVHRLELQQWRWKLMFAA